MAQPSIKGTLVSALVHTLDEAIGNGTITREQAEKELGPAGIDLFDGVIVPSLWYDIAAFGRLAEFLRDHLGDGDDAYLIEIGRDSARRLRDSGLSAQLDFLDRTGRAEQTDVTRKAQAEMARSLFQSLYNFGTYLILPDLQHPARYMVEIRDAAAYPDPCAWRTVGFMNEMAAWRGGGSDVWYFERPTPDVVRFRMNRDPQS